MVAHFYRLAILSALLVNREQIRSGFIADDEGVAVLKVVVAHKTLRKYNRTITASSNRGIRGFIWWKSTIRRGRSVWARQWENMRNSICWCHSHWLLGYGLIQKILWCIFYEGSYEPINAHYLFFAIQMDGERLVRSVKYFERTIVGGL